jgi:hypothetical protein
MSAAPATDVTVEVNVLSEQPRNNPADVVGITDSTQIAVKSVHACMLHSTASAYCEACQGAAICEGAGVMSPATELQQARRRAGLSRRSAIAAAILGACTGVSSALAAVRLDMLLICVA